MQLNYESKERFEKSYGDVMSLEEFIESCECGTFIDDDGVVGELLHKGNILYKGFLSTSTVMSKKQFLKGESDSKGSIEVVWYNR